MPTVHSVTSSNLDRLGYNPETQELLVIFKSGAAHLYQDVPSDIWNGLMASSSHGKYYIANIRAVFPAEKLSMTIAEAIERFSGGAELRPRVVLCGHRTRLKQGVQPRGLYLLAA